MFTRTIPVSISFFNLYQTSQDLSTPNRADLTVGSLLDFRVEFRISLPSTFWPAFYPTLGPSKGFGQTQDLNPLPELSRK